MIVNLPKFKAVRKGEAFQAARLMKKLSTRGIHSPEGSRLWATKTKEMIDSIACEKIVKGYNFPSGLPRLAIEGQPTDSGLPLFFSHGVATS